MAFIRLIRPCKMGENSFDFQSRRFHAFFYKRKSRIIRPDSNTVHPRVHLDVNLEGTSADGSCLRKLRQHILSENRRPDILPRQLLIGIREGISQHQNRLAHSAPPQDKRFLHRCNGKPVQTGHILQFMGDGNRPVSIAVHFHHSDQLDTRAYVCHHMLYIFMNGVQIHFRPDSFIFHFRYLFFSRRKAAL